MSDVCLSIFLGLGEKSTPVVADLRAMPHLLIAGGREASTGAILENIIRSLIEQYDSEKCLFVMASPIRGVLCDFSNIPQLVDGLATTPAEGIALFQGVEQEIEYRYRLMKKNGVRSIDDYNQKIALENNGAEPSLTGAYPEPYLIVAIESFDALIVEDEGAFIGVLNIISSMGRTAGVHLILTTNRPTEKVLSEKVLSCVPARVALRVETEWQSRLILGREGAEKLGGVDDLLFLADGAASDSPLSDTDPLRLKVEMAA